MIEVDKIRVWYCSTSTHIGFSGSHCPSLRLTRNAPSICVSQILAAVLRVAHATVVCKCVRSIVPVLGFECVQDHPTVLQVQQHDNNMWVLWWKCAFLSENDYKFIFLWTHFQDCIHLYGTELMLCCVRVRDMNAHTPNPLQRRHLMGAGGRRPQGKRKKGKKKERMRKRRKKERKERKKEGNYE